MRHVAAALTVAGALAYGPAWISTEARQAAAPAGPVKIELTEGKARYKVGERLVGVDFGNDAVGTTEAVTGTIVLKADGSIDASQSKITVDMRTLKSDQALRDLFLQSSVLETKQYPTLEFVPTTAAGLPFPLPMGTPVPKTTIIMPQAAGFKLTGNMTFHGVTKPVTWNVVSTISADAVAGRATTEITFETFGLTKPKVPLLASAEDTIRLELEFKASRSSM